MAIIIIATWFLMIKLSEKGYLTALTAAEVKA